MCRTLSHSSGWKSYFSYQQDWWSCSSASCSSWIMQQTDCALCILTTLLLPPQLLLPWLNRVLMFSFSFVPELKATSRTPSQPMWLHIYKVFTWISSEQQNVRQFSMRRNSNGILLLHGWESVNTAALFSSTGQRSCSLKENRFRFTKLKQLRLTRTRLKSWSGKGSICPAWCRCT